MKEAPLLLGPQALPVHLEQVVRRESPETLLMATQDPREGGAFRECQG